MTFTAIVFIIIVSLLSGLMGALSLRLFSFVEKKITEKEEANDLLLAFSRIFNTEYVLLDDAKKKKLNLLVNLAYNSLWGLLIPFVLFFMVPSDIASSSAGKSILYLILIIIVYFVIVHLANLLIWAYLLNKENPFWKWGKEANILEASRRVAFSIVSILSYLVLSWTIIFVFL